jgi:hypothetical protein
MAKTSMLAAMGLGLVLASTPVVAHHAFSAEFDASRPVTFPQAKVTSMDWVNPHVWIHVDVKMPNGKVENWGIECGAPNALFRRGFTKESMTAGTIIVVDGYQAKDGSRRANGRQVKLPNGQTLFLGSSGTGAPAESSFPAAKK